MNMQTEQLITDMRLGDAQAYERVAIFPVFHDRAGALEYLVLSEALEQGGLVVREVGEEGSVPDLLVHNKTQTPVLLLDGEEVVGAKQNRVLNTSILVPRESELKIPVSCTEEGRWHYETKEFADSDTVMPRKSRARKSQSVSRSLACRMGPRADQSQVWQDVQEMHAASGTASSPTGAMQDMFEGLRERTEEGLKAFPAGENQRGLIAVVNGRAAGMDIVSSASAYARLHRKLVKSYLVDGLLSRDEPGADGNGKAEAERFLAAARGCRESRHPAPGLGDDYRFAGPAILGSALVHEDVAVHAAFFAIDEKEAEDEPFASMRRRRRFRT